MLILCLCILKSILDGLIIIFYICNVNFFIKVKDNVDINVIYLDLDKICWIWVEFSFGSNIIDF